MTDINNDSMSINTENLCSICWSSMNDIYNTKCKHSFHKICIDKWLENNNTCPICRTIIKPIKHSNNTVVPINIPPQIEIRQPQAEVNQKSIIENKTFIKLLIIGFIINNFYNMTMLYLSSNYIDAYYNENISKEPSLFLIINIILIVLLPGTTIKKLHNNCAYISMMILYIILIICYVCYYKIIFTYFDILSLVLKINFAISSGLHIIFNIANFTTSNIIHFQLLFN